MLILPVDQPLAETSSAAHKSAFTVSAWPYPVSAASLANFAMPSLRATICSQVALLYVLNSFMAIV